MSTSLPAVVVVSHETRDEVLGLLASVPHGAEVVVVDAGSTDGTAAAVRAARPDARVLELVNAGYGRSANAGLRATTAAAVVVCNADVRFEAGALERLGAVLAADPGIGAAGPQVRYPDGALQASARRRPSARTALAHAALGRIAPANRWTRRYHGDDLDPSVPRDVDWLSGCAIALRRDAVAAIGGFDPGYFLFVEDVDLCERLRAAGWRVRYEPSARVVHRVGASTQARRWRSLVAHARSLDRYLTRSARGTRRALLRPLWRGGLAGWVVATYALERLVPGAGGRSTTGERRTPAGERPTPTGGGRNAGG